MSEHYYYVLLPMSTCVHCCQQHVRCSEMESSTALHAISHKTARHSSSNNLQRNTPTKHNLASYLELMPADVAPKLLPPGKIMTMRRVSKGMRETIEHSKPEVKIRVKNDDETVNNLAQNLLKMQSWCTIRSLDLHSVLQNAHNMQEIFEELGKCASLSYLNLADNAISDITASSLAAVLPQCTSLSDLDLSWNDIGFKAIRKLAAVLPRCASLAHLNLSVNSLRDNGAGELAAVLSLCTSLTHLNLSGNALGAEAASRLAAVLPQCSSLADLDLRWNDIGDGGAAVLVAVLPQCALLFHLDLRGNSIGHGGAAMLAASNQHSTVVVSI